MQGKCWGKSVVVFNFTWSDNMVFNNSFKKFTASDVNFLCIASLLISILYTWLRSEVRSGKLVCTWLHSENNNVFTKHEAGTFRFLCWNLVCFANLSIAASEKLLLIVKAMSFLCWFINNSLSILSKFLPFNDTFATTKH